MTDTGFLIIIGVGLGAYGASAYMIGYVRGLKRFTKSLDDAIKTAEDANRVTKEALDIVEYWKDQATQARWNSDWYDENHDKPTIN